MADTFLCHCCGHTYEKAEPAVHLRRETVQRGRVFKWRNALGSSGEGVVILPGGERTFVEENGPVVEITAWRTGYDPAAC